MKTFRIFAENRFIMENRNYRFRKATLADIPELKEMYKATLRAINKADYTPEEIEDWASCGDDIQHLTDLITNLYFIVALNEENQIIGFNTAAKNEIMPQTPFASFSLCFIAILLGTSSPKIRVK